MQKVHLICNAHLDPVWLWEWEEGAAAALSTFRVAADFCETFEGFVFNHNEVILYKWVEEYEPRLFERIQKLVAQGKWHIMGGWYLQSDCNMPSGESFIRQILEGRKYFKDKFGKVPTTAINFDPFGHSRGLVQIMNKSGYDSYIFCRPNQKDCPLPADEFRWVGYDGSSIIGHRINNGYNSPLGKAYEKIKGWIEAHPDKENSLILWGVGNHGGGASRIDLKNLKVLMEERKDLEIKHSIPEVYFKQVQEVKDTLPEHKGDLNAWAVGCYTSQIRIKQKHRLLENELFMAEKMLTHATLWGGINYPKEELLLVTEDLLTSQFHDSLPGSSIQPVEESILRGIDHGLEILARLKARAFFALTAGQVKAKEGEIPILIYNPHPYKVKGIFECEFQLADQNWTKEFTLPIVYQDGKKIYSQAEKELSNLNLDWRKRVVFEAELEPSQMNRFDCQLEVLPLKPKPVLKEEEGKLIFKTKELEVIINTATGLVDCYKVNGVNCLATDAFSPIVVDDDDDAWGMNVTSFRNKIGAFELLTKEQGTEFSGVKEGVLDSIRVVEDGEVRTVVEVMLGYNNSFICQTYKLPKQGTEVEVTLNVLWNEKSRMLKWVIPTLWKEPKYKGQVAFGVEELPNDGREAVSQKWSMIVSDKQDLALSCVNEGNYGLDCKDGEVRVSLLRSPGYSGHPIEDRPIMPDDRFMPRIDQGERHFKFWINVSSVQERIQSIDQEAMLHNEKPMVLSFFPSGEGENVGACIEVDDKAIQMSTIKQKQGANHYIIRLFETTGGARESLVNIPHLGISKKIAFKGYEIKTLELDPANKVITETSMMEGLL